MFKFESSRNQKLTTEKNQSASLRIWEFEFKARRAIGKRGRWYIKDACTSNDATLSSLSRSFFSSLCRGRTRCFQGLCGAMHTIPGVRARCKNVLHTTRWRLWCIQPLSCNVTSTNLHSSAHGDFAHRESKTEWNGTSLSVMLTSPNRDRRSRIIKSTAEKREGI